MVQTSGKVATKSSKCRDRDAQVASAAQGHSVRQAEMPARLLFREANPLNNNINNNNRNNNSNNNRRRGRSNRPQGGGGGQQLNRIDSRARGNAPQLLEKYRKLAHDAHLNGDRVQAEYYLQFADHYFRVTADSRVRPDEARGRSDEHWDGTGAEGDDASEFGGNNDFPSFDQPSFPRPPQGERPVRDERPAREDRPQRDERPARDEHPRQARAGQEERSNGDAADGNSKHASGEAISAELVEEVPANSFEPAENPFLRENRNRAGLRPRRAARPPQDDAEREPTGLDPALLPPAISVTRADDGAAAEPEAAKPRRGRPKRKPADDDAGEALETVG